MIKKISEMMKEDQENDGSFDYADDPEVNEYGDIYGCNVFSNYYHIDYTASLLDDIKEV